MCVDLVVFDLPYNILMKVVGWEFQVTVAFLRKVYKQVFAVNEMENWVLALMHKPTDSQIVEQSLVEAGCFQHMQHFYWYQTDQSSPTPVSSYTNSVQMGTFAFVPDRTKVQWNVSKDPRCRHNYIACKSVTTLHRNEENKVINPCQKPPDIMKWMCNNHCAPGSNVLVLGAGAGGEVFGATEACCNVVAVESDPDQFRALRRILVLKMTGQLDRLQLDSPVNSATSSPNGTKTHSTILPEQASNTNSEEGEEAARVTCLDCRQAIDPEFLDVTRLCAHCTIKGPLHQNCAVSWDGKTLCTKCHDKALDADTQLDDY